VARTITKSGATGTSRPTAHPVDRVLVTKWDSEGSGGGQSTLLRAYSVSPSKRPPVG